MQEILLLHVPNTASPASKLSSKLGCHMLALQGMLRPHLQPSEVAVDFILAYPASVTGPKTTFSSTRTALSWLSLILKKSVSSKMLIFKENNNVLLQTLFFKINDSRDNAVRVQEKVVFCPVTVNIFYGQRFLSSRLPS